MKRFLLPALLAAVALLGNGCAFMDPEDRDFYGKGWVKPTDLDTATVHHKIPDPSHPEPVPPAAPSAAPVASPEPEWLTPVPSTR